jgi:aryl carrier-like protein
MCVAAVGALLVSASDTRADDADFEFFEKKIRPLLVEHCYECHAAGAKKIGGKLLLDHRDGLLKGGESGVAIEPGKPDQSLLIQAVRYSDDAVQMPPQGKLPAAAIADLEEWIRRGAPDPRNKAPSAAKSADPTWDEILRTRRDWWSLAPVVQPAVPQPRNSGWSEHPVDRFILAKLEEKGLVPAQPADARTLARRLSLVLTGLPTGTGSVSPTRVLAVMPSSEDSETARQRDGEKGIESYVDELLASPHFGERWARHWMDVVRFTETHGNEWNYEVHHAWRYRDYLIRAFNDDVPFDQFVREHIAGDLLPEPRRNASELFNESVIGTSFFRFGEVNHDDCISLRQIGYDLLDNQIDTLTKAFQATTVACARCHDHKLDAVSMHDYYALLGVLRSSRLVSHTIDGPQVNARELERLGQLKAQIRGKLAQLWLRDAEQTERYMLAAAAQRQVRPDADELAQGLDPQRLAQWAAVLRAAGGELDDPFEPWRATIHGPAGIATWQNLAEKFTAEDRRRQETQSQYTTWADFRTNFPPDWQVGGMGLRSGPAPSGEFVLHPVGDSLVKAVLPAGTYTHAVSEKLNGTLRSPVVPLGKKRISLLVAGERSSAVRLVSNHCQLNYKNYRALISSDFTWVTFELPDDRDSLRTYAELMTMLDNPKFPDQLSALGGDNANYKLPWEKAAENPRSYFGITRVVLHDCAEPPPAELSHLRPLLADPAPDSPAALAARYRAVIQAAIDRWAAGEATDDSAQWLAVLVRRGLVTNQVAVSPELVALVKEYRAIEASLSSPRVVAGIADGGVGIEQPVFTRGDCARPGDAVPRRYLEVLAGSRVAFAAPGSGRLELAERIASPDNPLTARVFVNRIWHHLFGTGLVRTVDDFGHVGELPSHPELLDYLAAEFVADGWSVKRLIRRLVLSKTFQLASRPSEQAAEIDPENRLLSHYPARRMEAEVIRDSILAASGRLDVQQFGMSVQPFREKDYADRRLFAGPLDGHGRRSIYIKNNLMESPKFLSAFNLPGGKVTQGRRDVTNVPAQALALLNDPFVIAQAELWASRLIACENDMLAARIDAMFQTALSRPPSAGERERFAQAATALGQLHGVAPGGLLQSQTVWKDIAHAMFNLQEFVYIP